MPLIKLMVLLRSLLQSALVYLCAAFRLTTFFQRPSCDAKRIGIDELNYFDSEREMESLIKIEECHQYHSRCDLYYEQDRIFKFHPFTHNLRYKSTYLHLHEINMKNYQVN